MCPGKYARFGMTLLSSHTPIELGHMTKERNLKIDPFLLSRIEKSPYALDDLIHLARTLTLERDSINKLYQLNKERSHMEMEFLKREMEHYKNLEKAKTDKVFLLKKYKGVNEPVILVETWNIENNPDVLVVEESKYSGYLDDINLFLLDPRKK